MTSVEADLVAGAPPRSTSRPRIGLRRRGRSLTATVVAFALVGGVAVIPVIVLLWSSFNVAAPGEATAYGLENWRHAFSDPDLGSALRNTLTLGLARTVIGSIVAISIAWLISRTDMRGARVVEFFMWLMFFTPTLALTLGWKLLLDPDFGLVNEWLRHLPGLSSLDRGPVNINSFWGIVWVQLTANTIPAQVVLITPAFRRMSAVLEQSARVCGAGRFRTVRSVLLPVMAPSILGAALLSFIWSLKTFEAELLLGTPAGIDVYSTQIYRWVRDEFPPQYGNASALGSLFIVIMIVLAVGYRLLLRGKDYVTISANTYSDAPTQLSRRGRIAAHTLCWAFIFFGAVLPFAAVVLGSMMRRFGFFNLDSPYTLESWRVLFGDPLFVSSLKNTLVLGFGAALLGSLFYMGVAVITERSRIRGRGGIAVLAWFPVAVPGILLSLSFLWVFLATPLKGVLYGTTFGLICAVVVGHMSTGTQQMGGALMQVSTDHEHAARVTGATRLRTYGSILLPLIAPSMVAAAMLTFASAARDIGSVVLLSGPESRPLSVLMLEYSYGGSPERGAALGVLLSVMMALLALAARWLGGGSVGARARRRGQKREALAAT